MRVNTASGTSLYVPFSTEIQNAHQKYDLYNVSRCSFQLAFTCSVFIHTFRIHRGFTLLDNNNILPG